MQLCTTNATTSGGVQVWLRINTVFAPNVYETPYLALKVLRSPSLLGLSGVSFLRDPWDLDRRGNLEETLRDQGKLKGKGKFNDTISNCCYGHESKGAYKSWSYVSCTGKNPWSKNSASLLIRPWSLSVQCSAPILDKGQREERSRNQNKTLIS